MMTDTRLLLDDFARHKSETAFREIVSRYLNLVYSSALRMVDGDEHRAKDVAQIVFADLARKAGELSPEVMLGGWLHRHTCFVAANTLRGERRRLARERKAVEMNLLQDDSDVDFSRLAPLLDETINQLEEADRTAILLRFFEQKDFRAVGESIDGSEDAARKRVNRALEKLRDLLAQRGIRTTAAALSVAITANAVQSAPAGLAVAISAAAFAGASVTSSTVIAAAKTITMTALQKTVVAAALTATVGAGIYEAKQARDARAEAQAIRQQQEPLAVEVARLRAEDNQLSNLLAQANDQKQLSQAQYDELLKLRGQSSVKKSDAKVENDPAFQQAQVWLARVKKIREQFESHPDQKIPEMQFLKEEQWLNVARIADVDTDNAMRCALCNVRTAAIYDFGGKLSEALRAYMAANQMQLPDTASQLAGYFQPPLSDADALLSRYIRLTSEQTADPNYQNAVFVQDPSTLPDDIDRPVLISTNVTSSFNPPQEPFVSLPDVLEPVSKAYADAHHDGFLNVADLRPYATTPEQKAALNKLIQPVR